MNYLDFINNKKTNSKIKSKIYESFKTKDFEKAYTLIGNVIKQNVKYTVSGFNIKNLELVKVNIDKKTLYSDMHYCFSDNKVVAAFCFNFLQNDEVTDLYSISIFFDEAANDLLWMVKDVVKCHTINLLGQSVAYFIPLLVNALNAGKLDKTVAQINSEINKEWGFDEALETTVLLGHQEYTFIEGLSQETIFDTTFPVNEVADKEVRDYLKQKGKERNERYKNKKPGETYASVSKEYNAIKDAIANGADTMEKLKIALISNSSFKVNVDSINTAETSFKEQMQKMDPEELFKQSMIYVKSVCSGLQPGLIICGAPGIGKTYRVTKKLEELGYVDESDVTTDDGEKIDIREYTGAKLMHQIKGKITTRLLYINLYKYNKKGNIVLLDDADGVVGPKAEENAINILKAALDSSSTPNGRKINYLIAGKVLDDEGNEIPKEFYYNGGVIVLTNYQIGELNEALRGRVFTQSLEFSNKQLLELIKKLIPNLCKDLVSDAAKQKAYDYLVDLDKQNVEMVISIRSFITCAKLYSMVDGEDLSEDSVKYMIKEQMHNQALDNSNKRK